MEDYKKIAQECIDAMGGLENIKTVSMCTTRLRIEVRDETVTPIEKFQIKYVSVIDLTTIFGVGNEPTKEEMDELVRVTGFIDDEYLLNNKEMMMWTISLIRRNKNTIIALGGTI